MRVPHSLRTWFIVHFIADYLFAIPLFLAPITTLTWLGWSTIDPFATRIVAAALFGIGGVSVLVRDKNADVYHAMLTLKIIWSITAIIGMITTMIGGGTWFGWAIVAIFTTFSIVWCYYKIQLIQHKWG